MKSYHSVHLKFQPGNSQDMLAWDYLTELCSARGCTIKFLIVDALIHYGHDLCSIEKLTFEEKTLVEKFGNSIVEAVKAELARLQPLTVAVPVAAPPETIHVPEPDPELDSTEESISEGTDLSGVEWNYLSIGNE